MKIDLEKELKENQQVIVKGLKLRVYPNKEQEVLINKTIGCARFVYNFCLGKQKEKEKMWYTINEMVQQGYFSENNYHTEYFKVNDMDKWNTALKKDDNYSWLKEVDKCALQNSVKDLGEAYKKFYSRKGGRPKFKSKKENEQSYMTTCTRTKSKHKDGTVVICENIRFEDNYSITIPKVGSLKFKKQKLPKKFNILNATVKRSKSNKYYVSLNYETIVDLKSKTNKNVGIDLGIKSLATFSDGIIIPNQKFLKNEEKRIIRLQQVLSRKTIGSMNWWKIKNKLTRLNERVTNRRYDFIQKLTTNIVKNYDVICIENLDTKSMYQNSDIAKLLQDVPFGMFKDMLKYKAEWYGKKVIEVNRYYPSSQLCNKCSFQYKGVKDLNVREWICPNCGEKHDRDLNASLNILKEGLRLLNKDK